MNFLGDPPREYRGDLRSPSGNTYYRYPAYAPPRKAQTKRELPQSPVTTSQPIPTSSLPTDHSILSFLTNCSPRNPDTIPQLNSLFSSLSAALPNITAQTTFYRVLPTLLSYVFGYSRRSITSSWALTVPDVLRLFAPPYYPDAPSANGTIPSPVLTPLYTLLFRLPSPPMYAVPIDAFPIAVRTAFSQLQWPADAASAELTHLSHAAAKAGRLPAFFAHRPLLWHNLPGHTRDTADVISASRQALIDAPAHRDSDVADASRFHSTTAGVALLPALVPTRALVPTSVSWHALVAPTPTTRLASSTLSQAAQHAPALCVALTPADLFLFFLMQALARMPTAADVILTLPSSLPISSALPPTHPLSLATHAHLATATAASTPSPASLLALLRGLMLLAFSPGKVATQQLMDLAVTMLAPVPLPDTAAAPITASASPSAPSKPSSYRSHLSAYWSEPSFSATSTLHMLYCAALRDPALHSRYITLPPPPHAQAIAEAQTQAAPPPSARAFASSIPDISGISHPYFPDPTPNVAVVPHTPASTPTAPATPSPPPPSLISAHLPILLSSASLALARWPAALSPSSLAALDQVLHLTLLAMQPWALAPPHMPFVASNTQVPTPLPSPPPLSRPQSVSPAAYAQWILAALPLYTQLPQLFAIRLSSLLTDLLTAPMHLPAHAPPIAAVLFPSLAPTLLSLFSSAPPATTSLPTLPAALAKYLVAILSLTQQQTSVDSSIQHWDAVAAALQEREARMRRTGAAQTNNEASADVNTVPKQALPMPSTEDCRQLQATLARYNIDVNAYPPLFLPLRSTGTEASAPHRVRRPAPPPSILSLRHFVLLYQCRAHAFAHAHRANMLSLSPLLISSSCCGRCGCPPNMGGVSADWQVKAPPPCYPLGCTHPDFKITMMNNEKFCLPEGFYAPPSLRTTAAVAAEAGGSDLSALLSMLERVWDMPAVDWTKLGSAYDKLIPALQVREESASAANVATLPASSRRGGSEIDPWSGPVRNYESPLLWSFWSGVAQSIERVTLSSVGVRVPQWTRALANVETSLVLVAIVALLALLIFFKTY